MLGLPWLDLLLKQKTFDMSWPGSPSASPGTNTSLKKKTARLDGLLGAKPSYFQLSKLRVLKIELLINKWLNHFVALYHWSVSNNGQRLGTQRSRRLNTFCFKQHRHGDVVYKVVSWDVDSLIIVFRSLMRMTWFNFSLSSSASFKLRLYIL